MLPAVQFDGAAARTTRASHAVMQPLPPKRVYGHARDRKVEKQVLQLDCTGLSSHGKFERRHAGLQRTDLSHPPSSSSFYCSLGHPKCQSFLQQ